jgi:PspA-Associated protein
MVIRVQGSGQYRLADEALSGLNAIDSQLQDAVARRDEQAATSILYKMIAYVQTEGTPIDHDEIVPSDAILPPDNLTYEEIVSTLKEDGLIPG